MTINIKFPGTDEHGNVQVDNNGYPVFHIFGVEILQQRVFSFLILLVGFGTIVYFIYRYYTIDRFLISDIPEPQKRTAGLPPE